MPQVPKDMIRFKQHVLTCFPFFNDELRALYHEKYTLICQRCMNSKVNTATGVVTRKEMLVQDFPPVRCDHRTRGSQAHRSKYDEKGRRNVPCITIERALQTFYEPNLVATHALINTGAKNAVEREAGLPADIPPPPPPPGVEGGTGEVALHPVRRA